MFDSKLLFLFLAAVVWTVGCSEPASKKRKPISESSTAKQKKPDVENEKNKEPKGQELKTSQELKPISRDEAKDLKFVFDTGSDTFICNGRKLNLKATSDELKKCFGEPDRTQSVLGTDLLIWDRFGFSVRYGKETGKLDSVIFGLLKTADKMAPKEEFSGVIRWNGVDLKSDTKLDTFKKIQGFRAASPNMGMATDGKFRLIAGFGRGQVSMIGVKYLRK